MINIPEKKCKNSLVVTTVASTIDQFCMSNIAILSRTCSVQVASNFTLGNNTSEERIKEFRKELLAKDIIINEVNFNRNPFSSYNFLAYKDLKKIISMNFFDLIHCHTPIAAMLVRIAARKKRKNGTKIIYTAHGFHFFNGAPIKNWVIYYPIEKWLARYTDVLITINREDYFRAKKSFCAGRVEYIPGVGVDMNKLSELFIDKSKKRKQLGVPEKCFLLLSVGELNSNKNHETVVKAIAKLKDPNVFYLICGQGLLEMELVNLIKKLDLEKQVKLLGFREDIAEICKAADVFVFPSFREGLSLALMEAMALGLPVICSRIRGNTDLIEDGKGGYLVEPDDVDGFASSIKSFTEGKVDIADFCNWNLKRIKSFDKNEVNKKINELYNQSLCNK